MEDGKPFLPSTVGPPNEGAETLLRGEYSNRVLIAHLES